jgi:hypothetical protein
MNPLLSAPHRRDVILGDEGNEWLIRLFALEGDDTIRDVRYTISPVIRRDAERRPAFLCKGGGPHPTTYEPGEAAVHATCSVRHDGLTSVHVDTVIDSKKTLWGLLAAIEQARREAALEMGSAYMDRFEYGKEKRRG